MSSHYLQFHFIESETNSDQMYYPHEISQALVSLINRSEMGPGQVSGHIHRCVKEVQSSVKARPKTYACLVLPTSWKLPCLPHVQGSSLRGCLPPMSLVVTHNHLLNYSLVLALFCCRSILLLTNLRGYSCFCTCSDLWTVWSH